MAQITEKMAILGGFLLWAIPIAVTIVVAFYIYMLSHFTGPIERLKTENGHLLQDNKESKKERDALKKQIALLRELIIRMQVEMKNRRRACGERRNLQG